MRTPCYVFDIDGTIANGDHRLHHIQKEPKDWDAYLAACPGDTPFPHVWKLATDLARSTPVIYVSGRSDQVRSETLQWLIACAFPDPNGVLYMRKAGDHRPDYIIKMELLAEIRFDGFKPIMVFDDRDQVVKAWRGAGIPCAQVAEGDF